MAGVPVLPRYLAFEGDNDQLLIISATGKSPMLEFNGDEGLLQDMWSVHEVTVVDSATGTVAIKYMGNGLYWQQSADNPYGQYTIMANLDRLPGPSDKNALFVPVSVTRDTVALRNVEADRFCDRRAYNFLLPRAEKILTSSKMTVADPVQSRSLVDVVYLTDEANVNNRRKVSLASQTARNNSSYEADVSLEIKYKNECTSTWSNSVTVGVGVTMKFQVGAPLVADGGVEVSSSVSYERQWGESKTTSTEITGTYTAKSVSPGHTVKVTVTANEAQCDVPFTYTQLDTLPDGKQRRTSFADGLFTGANLFDVDFDCIDVTDNKLSLHGNRKSLHGKFVASFPRGKLITNCRV